MTSAIENNKFAYALNAILYCLWLADIKYSELIRKAVFTILSPIPKYVFTKKYRAKFYENQAIGLKNRKKHMLNRKDGYHIQCAKYIFNSHSAAYPGFIALVAAGFIIRFTGELPLLIFSPIVFILITIGAITEHKLLYSHDKYLNYFKQFDKEDEHWHKKWNRITTVFCVGAVVSILLGLLTASAILIL